MKRPGLLLVVVLVALCVTSSAGQLSPGDFISKLLTSLINDQKLLPKTISVDQTVSGIKINSVDFSGNPTVLSLNITGLSHPSQDIFSFAGSVSVTFPSVTLNTSLGIVDIGTTVGSVAVSQGSLQLPCSSSSVKSAVSSLSITSLDVQNPSTDWVVKLFVSTIDKNPIVGPLLSSLIPFPIDIDAPEQVSVVCIMPVVPPFRTLVTSDMTPSDFLVAMLNNVIKTQANTPIDVQGCKGTLNQINLCDTATSTAKSDAGAIIPCEAGCNTAYGACVAGTNICWGPCYAACKVVPWCHSSDCDSKCGRDKCGSVKDSCISDCYRALTWNGGAGLDSVSNIGNTLAVSQLNLDSASGTWTAQLKLSPSARLKFMCDPVVPSWQFVSSGLGEWTVTLRFRLACDASSKISGFQFTDYSLTGFDVKVISGVFGAFSSVPGFGELMGDLNGVVQNAIYGAVSSKIKDTLENGMQGLCPVDTQGISLC